jgi:hypothetical protein
VLSNDSGGAFFALLMLAAVDLNSVILEERHGLGAGVEGEGEGFADPVDADLKNGAGALGTDVTEEIAEVFLQKAGGEAPNASGGGSTSHGQDVCASITSDGIERLGGATRRKLHLEAAGSALALGVAQVDECGK